MAARVGLAARLALDVRHAEHRVHSDLGHRPVRAVDNLGGERRHRDLDELLLVVERVLEGVRDLGEVRRRHRARLVVALRHTHRVDAAVEQRLRLLEQRPRQHHHARRAVADLVVLRLAQLDEQLADLVLHLHLLQDRRAVVRDAHVAVGALQHLVHSLWPQRRAQDRRDRLRGKDVGLLRLQSAHPSLLLSLRRVRGGMAGRQRVGRRRAPAGALSG